MIRVYLLRHAKSDWSDPSLADFDRPLNKRGRKAAPVMGRYLRKHKLLPDLVLCSSAVRAQQTWARTAEELKDEVPVKYLRSLYLAPPSRLLAALHRVPSGTKSVLLVAHNPGMEHLAAQLAGSGEATALARMGEKFPTAALAVFSFETDDWRSLAPGTGRLEAFVIPRDLT